jgi:hypothetical protein
MDDQQTRQQIQEHADAVLRGDMSTVVADFSEGLRPHVAELAQALPSPVTEAEVVSVEVGEDDTVAHIRYAGADREVTIRSRWQDEGGRPVIVHAEPAG